MTIEAVTLTGAPDGLEYLIPEHHYSDKPTEAVFFYGGPFSNFVGGPWTILSNQPWLAQPDTKGAPDLQRYKATYETIEHFFAASKAVTQRNHDTIRDMRGPLSAKRAGRRTELRPDWEEVKFKVMLTGLRVKFDVIRTSGAPGLAYRGELLATGDRLIAEDSPTDYVWGIRDRHHGYSGQNLLGKALMQIRQELRS